MQKTKHTFYSLYTFTRYTGVRAFVTKPVATNLQYVGGAAAILGLVAMASDVEGLYAAVKALVCVVKSNPLASKEMERIKGYQVRHRALILSLTHEVPEYCILSFSLAIDNVHLLLLFVAVH